MTAKKCTGKNPPWGEAKVWLKREGNTKKEKKYNGGRERSGKIFKGC